MTGIRSLFVSLRLQKLIGIAREATRSRRGLFAVVILTLVWSAVLSSQATAGVLFDTAVANPSGASDGDGPISGTVEFIAVDGGIEVKVTNTSTLSKDEPGLAKGQAISVVSFMVNLALFSPAVAAPSAFTKLTAEGGLLNPATGQMWTSGTSTDLTGSNNVIDHWGFNVTTSSNISSVLLATAGSGAPPNNPVYMILPSTGTAGSGNSLANSQQDPYIVGPGDFFITVAGVMSSTTLTAAMFSDVDLQFGTKPDSGPIATGSGVIITDQSAIPEPGSIAVWGVLGLVGTICWRRRRTQN